MSSDYGMQAKMNVSYEEAVEQVFADLFVGGVDAGPGALSFAVAGVANGLAVLQGRALLASGLGVA